MKACFNNLGIIIVAGGSGSRYGTKNKLMEMMSGFPLFIHSVRQFQDCCPNRNFILVVPEKELNLFREKIQMYLPGLEVILVAGGQTRGNSVWNGLQALDTAAEYVAVHDAARPLATDFLLGECLAAAVKFGGAIPGKPLNDTLKKTGKDGKVIATIPRDGLWRIETPQVFRTKELIEAYRNAILQQLEFTDDAGVMEIAGHPVYIVYNPDNNVKITCPEDLVVAQSVHNSVSVKDCSI